MERIVPALLYFPYLVFRGLLKYPQILSEHTSAWLLIGFGWRVGNMADLLPYPGGRVLAMFMMGIGAFQLASVIFQGRLRGLATGAAFTVWLFLSCFVSPYHSSVAAAAYPVMCVSCALSYLSINRQHIVS